MEFELNGIQDRIRELEDMVSYIGPVSEWPKIRVSSSNGYPRYYLRKGPDDRWGTYLPASEEATIQNILQQNYYGEVLEKAQKELEFWRKVLAEYPETVVEDIYPKLHPARKAFIKPMELPIDEFVQQWKAVKWEGKPFRPDDESEYYNKLGVRLKSKEEVILSDRFIDRGVPQRYEYPVILQGMGEVHPDFMLLNKRTRKEYYWEHLGMWDDMWYRQNAIKKLVAYQRNGIFVGEQLILTFETKSYHPGLYDIDQLIDHYLV